MEAAPVDQAASAWGCNGTSIPGANNQVTGTGAANTAAIVSGCAQANTAAKVTDTYVLNGYTDWYLPSRDELYLLYLQRALVNATIAKNSYYQSSSQLNNSTTTNYIRTFNSDNEYGNPKGTAELVRAVRSF